MCDQAERAVAGQRGLRTDAAPGEAQRPGEERPRARRMVGLDDVGEGIADQLGEDDEEDQAEDHERVAGQRQPRRPHDDVRRIDEVDDRCEHEPDEHVGEDDDGLQKKPPSGQPTIVSTSPFVR